MEAEPVFTCVTRLQQAGWQVAPAASPWQAITDIHAHRWWTGQLVDSAVLALTTGQGLAQRIQVTTSSAGPAHRVVAATGPMPFDQLTTLLEGWPAPTPAEETGQTSWETSSPPQADAHPAHDPESR